VRCHQSLAAVPYGDSSSEIREAVAGTGLKRYGHFSKERLSTSKLACPDFSGDPCQCMYKCGRGSGPAPQSLAANAQERLRDECEQK